MLFYSCNQITSKSFFNRQIYDSILCSTKIQLIPFLTRRNSTTQSLKLNFSNSVSDKINFEIGRKFLIQKIIYQRKCSRWLPVIWLFVTVIKKNLYALKNYDWNSAYLIIVYWLLFNFPWNGWYRISQSCIPITTPSVRQWLQEYGWQDIFHNSIWKITFHLRNWLYD